MQSLKEIVIDIPEQSAVSLGRFHSVEKSWHLLVLMDE